MTAAAEAHHATDAPIAVHLKPGTGALDVIALLCGESGVPVHRVILGHHHRAADAVVHRQAAEAGCRLAFGGPSRAHHATDRRMPDAVRALAGAGFGDRPALGGDTTTAAARSVGGGPGMPYLLRRVRPRPARRGRGTRGADPGGEPGTGLRRRVALTPGPARAFRWTPGRCP
ncbi:putative metal-dependent phosphotriesterase family hydrolase [Streptomyces sp. 3330]|nr:putative metal-dependent phosphotriesterase family hydrolase [Streptomyces sp. 3330]